MFVIAQYMLSASTVFTRRPAKAVVCQLFQLLYLLSFSRGKCPLTPPCLLITPSTSLSFSRGKCPLTPSCLLITPSTSRAPVRGKCPLTPSAFS